MKKEFIKQRFVRALYMGFLLDKEANEYLNKNHQLNYKKVKKYIDNYNEKLDIKDFKIKVNINSERYNCTLNVLGQGIYLKEEEFRKLLDEAEKLIWDNIQYVTKSYSEEGILVYDINLLEPLSRSGVTTMGDKYNAYFNKRYTVNFIRLYDIGGII